MLYTQNVNYSKGSGLRGLLQEHWVNKKSINAARKIAYILKLRAKNITGIMCIGSIGP
jgi:hypothetical protein